MPDTSGSEAEGRAKAEAPSATPSRTRAALQRVGVQMPMLPYTGLAFWVAWNLLAFSGGPWFVETDTSWRVSALFVAHLVACVVTLLALAFHDGWASKALLRDRFAVTGGLLAAAGCALVVAARPDLLHSPYVFYAGCALTGAGTTLLFARSAPLYGSLNPKASFTRLCEAVLIAAAAYFVVRAMPAPASTVAFALLPVLSALLLCTQPDETRDVRELRLSPGPRHDLSRFFASVLVYSMSVQVLRTSLIPIPPADGVRSYDLMLMLLIVACAFFLFGTVAMARPFDLGLVYMPTTLVIVVFLIVVPVLDLDPVVGGALTGSATYGFNVLVWSMLSYLVFRSHADAVRVFCLGNAMVAMGSIAGDVLSSALLASGLGSAAFDVVCMALVALAAAVSVLVFPEHVLSDLLPVYSGQVRDAQEARHRAPWREACERVAEEHGLSERESEVFFEIARGRTNQQVSEKFVISPYTTRAHVRHIYKKLDVHSREELMDMVARSEKGQGR